MIRVQSDLVTPRRDDLFDSKLSSRPNMDWVNELGQEERAFLAQPAVLREFEQAFVKARVNTDNFGDRRSFFLSFRASRIPRAMLSERSFGGLPLVQAVASGDERLVRLHLEEDSDLTAPLLRRTEKLGSTAKRVFQKGKVLFSCEAGSNNVAAYDFANTLASVFQPHRLPHEGRSALTAAAMQKKPEILKLLCEHLVKQGQIDALDMSDATGASPLTLACEAGDLPTIEILLAYGANADKADALGRSPVTCSILSEHPFECVRSLTYLGVDVQCANQNGHTPLYLATLRGHANVIYLLHSSKCLIDPGQFSSLIAVLPGLLDGQPGRATERVDQKTLTALMSLVPKSVQQCADNPGSVVYFLEGLKQLCKLEELKYSYVRVAHQLVFNIVLANPSWEMLQAVVPFVTSWTRKSFYNAVAEKLQDASASTGDIADFIIELEKASPAVRKVCREAIELCWSHAVTHPDASILRALNKSGIAGLLVYHAMGFNVTQIIRENEDSLSEPVALRYVRAFDNTRYLLNSLEFSRCISDECKKQIRSDAQAAFGAFLTKRNARIPEAIMAIFGREKLDSIERILMRPW